MGDLREINNNKGLVNIIFKKYKKTNIEKLKLYEMKE